MVSNTPHLDSCMQTSNLSIVFYATIPFGFLLTVAAFFIPNMEKFLTNNVGKRLQRMGTKDGETVEGQDISVLEKAL